MKLTDTQVNELISARKKSIQGDLETELIDSAVDAWCDPQGLENMVCDTDLWDELNALDAYMSPKQSNRYTDEIRVEIYKAIVREVRQSNPLLAAAFDATKPTTK